MRHKKGGGVGIVSEKKQHQEGGERNGKNSRRVHFVNSIIWIK